MKCSLRSDDDVLTSQCVLFFLFVGSDSLSGVLSPKPHNNSTEELRGGSFKKKQGRRRHASAEVKLLYQDLSFVLM